MPVKNILLALGILFIASNGFSQTSFDDKFKEGILALGNNQEEKALEVFKELYKKDQTNANLAYLYGRCLAELGKDLPIAITLLEKAKPSFSEDYQRGNSAERNASEYTYFYLLMAYSKNGMCDKTLETLHEFYRIYSYTNEWYLIEGQRLHHDCEVREEESTNADRLANSDTMDIPDRPAERENIQVNTKPKSYSAKSSIYGVQVGASIEPKFTYEFLGLKNVDVYLDDNGVFRYIIGSFVYKGQAENLLESVLDMGYEEAFLVNINDKKLFGAEVTTINNQPITSKTLAGKVDFRVQIGAYAADTIPNDLMQLYFEVDSITEVRGDELTYMTVGSFDTYDGAKFYEELLKDMGIKDAFVVAFNYNSKVSIGEAEYYLDMQRRSQQKKEDKETEEEGKKKKKKRKKK